MKRLIKKTSFDSLEKELNFFTDKGVIKSDQRDTILKSYDIKEKISFVRVVLIIGAILVGLGVLSFVASNWQVINSSMKIGIIIVGLGVSMYMSFRTSRDYEKTSKALLYLSILFFGAGIFLIGQIFNISGEFSGAFIIWGIGTICIGYIFEEKSIFSFSILLFMIFIGMNMKIDFGLHLIGILLITEIAYFFIPKNGFLCFLNNLKLLFVVWWVLAALNIEGIYGVLLFLLIGVLMNFVNQKVYTHIYSIQGRIIIGITGIILTFEDVWKDIFASDVAQVISIIVGILVFAYFLLYVRKQSVIALVFLCVLVFRYYMDTLFSFLPKSIFFIIGGIILLGFGFYFERIRKANGGIQNEIEIK